MNRSLLRRLECCAFALLLASWPSTPSIETRDSKLHLSERYGSEALALSPELPYRDRSIAAVSRRRFLQGLISLVMTARFTAAQSGDQDHNPKRLLDRVLDRTGGAQALRLRYPEFDRAVLLLIPPDDQALRHLAKAYILYLLVKNKGMYGFIISKEAHEVEDYFRDKVLQTAGGKFLLAFRMATEPSRKNLERNVYQAIAKDLQDVQSSGYRLLALRLAEGSDLPVEISRVTADVMMSAFLRYFGLTGAVWEETRQDWSMDDEFLTTDLGLLQQVVKVSGVSPFRLDFSAEAGFCVSAISAALFPKIKATHLDKKELSVHLPKSKANGVIDSMINELGASRFINSLQSLRTYTGLSAVLAPYWLRAADEERLVMSIQSIPIPGRAWTQPPGWNGLTRAA